MTKRKIRSKLLLRLKIQKEEKKKQKSEAIKKKLLTPPLQGRLDITIKKRKDGVEIVFLPKSNMNKYAFEHLLVIDPKEDVPATFVSEKAQVQKLEPKLEPKLVTKDYVDYKKKDSENK